MTDETDTGERHSQLGASAVHFRLMKAHCARYWPPLSCPVSRSSRSDQVSVVRRVLLRSRRSMQNEQMRAKAPNYPISTKAAAKNLPSPKLRIRLRSQQATLLLKKHDKQNQQNMRSRAKPPKLTAAADSRRTNRGVDTPSRQSYHRHASRKNKLTPPHKGTAPSAEGPPPAPGNQETHQKRTSFLRF